jgi:hypothetical protein
MDRRQPQLIASGAVQLCRAAWGRLDWKYCLGLALGG